uniref:Dynein light intermediate chain n=1 Tax=Panagrolaimus sp. JU765 TaxID=591449 RepID=A0AC34RNT2_9BILA
MLDVEANTLIENCGAPIVVVLSKCDLQHELNDDQFNKLLYHLRKFCQARGAALVCTSVKDDINVQLLYKYLVHRVYGLPFTSSACIVGKDSIFIPTGWESNQKLAILAEELKDLSLPTSAANDSRLRNKENAVMEDEEVFLAKLAEKANKPLAGS